MSTISSLENFLTEMTRITGMELCLFDLNYFTKDAPELNLGSQRRIHACTYCRVVKSKTEAWRKCIETEYWRAEQSAKQEEPLLHTCHAGITDLIVPIMYRRKQIGALYLGQIITNPAKKQQGIIAQLARKYGHTPEELTRTADQQPHQHPDQLEGYGPLLQAIRAHVEQAVELVALRRQAAEAAKLREKISTNSQPTLEDVPLYFLDRFNPESQQIQHALQLIARGYSRNITQPTVAREVGLSTSKFSRLFHAETGMTFRTCVMLTRLEAAGYLLKRASLTVTEVAELVGYQNNTSMQRAFRRLKGVTPKEFIHRQGEQEFCIPDEKGNGRPRRNSEPEQAEPESAVANERATANK